MVLYGHLWHKHKHNHNKSVKNVFYHISLKSILKKNFLLKHFFILIQLIIQSFFMCHVAAPRPPLATIEGKALLTWC